METGLPFTRKPVCPCKQDLLGSGNLYVDSKTHTAEPYGLNVLRHGLPTHAMHTFHSMRLIFNDDKVRYVCAAVSGRETWQVVLF